MLNESDKLRFVGGVLMLLFGGFFTGLSVGVHSVVFLVVGCVLGVVGALLLPNFGKYEK